jgi:DNA-binding MarR family transcriptional regulator
VVRRLRAARRAWLRQVLSDFDDDERAQFAELFDRFVESILIASEVPPSETRSSG